MSDMRARVLICTENLPAHNSSAERVAMARADIEDAVGKIQRKLTDYASRQHVLGWKDDPDGMTFETVGLRVTGQLRITREDD